MPNPIKEIQPENPGFIDMTAHPRFSALSQSLIDDGYTDLFIDGSRYVLIPKDKWKELSQLINIQNLAVTTPQFVREATYKGEDVVVAIIPENSLSFARIDLDYMSGITPGVLKEPEKLIQDFLIAQDLNDISVDLKKFTYDPRGLIIILQI